MAVRVFVAGGAGVIGRAGAAARGPAGDVPVVMVTVDRGEQGHPSWRQGFEEGLA
ncbi:hypothetical protein GCM10018965_072070 [Nonomuraea roseola]